MSNARGASYNVHGCRLEFLNVEVASAHVAKYHREYIAGVRDSPINRGVRSFGSVDEFNDHVCDWSFEHIRRVVLSMLFICERVLGRQPSDAGSTDDHDDRWKQDFVLYAPPWRFVCVDAQLEGGMPHTIHDAIVLPKTIVSSLHLPGILLHERIHVLQKQFPQLFDTLYREWGWEPVHDAMALPPCVARWHRHNPDTPRHWSFVEQRCAQGQCSNVRFVPIASLETSSSMNDAAYLAVPMTTTNTMPSRSSMSIDDGDTTPPLKTLEAYSHMHDGCAHCYHPDENAAVIIAALLGRRGTPHPRVVRSPAAKTCVAWAKWMHRQGLLMHRKRSDPPERV